MILYRIAISIFAGVVLLPLALRGRWGAIAARLGRDAGPEGAQPHLWWHGASLGELAAARPLLAAIIAARPNLHIIVTANTETGLREARGWALPRVAVRPAPLDLAWVTRRFIRRWRVVAHVTLEAELWPHRVLRTPGPVLLIGARLSAKTARGWARGGALLRRVLDRIAFVSPQNPKAAGRLRALGLDAAVLGPPLTLKAFYTPRALPPDPGVDGAFDRGATWLAASTHPGEEGIVLDAHIRALQAEPALHMILAPRHPDRGDAVAALIADHGFRCIRRSAGGVPEPGAVFLADTTGEMDRWYRAAGRVFIGGTLAPRGGHTPFEPAAFGAALIHGPDTANFAAPFRALQGIAVQVGDAAALAAALTALKDPARQTEQGRAAQAALRTETGMDALVQHVLRVLPPPGA